MGACLTFLDQVSALGRVAERHAQCLLVQRLGETGLRRLHADITSPHPDLRGPAGRLLTRVLNLNPVTLATAASCGVTGTLMNGVWVVSVGATLKHHFGSEATLLEYVHSVTAASVGAGLPLPPQTGCWWHYGAGTEMLHTPTTSTTGGGGRSPIGRLGGGGGGGTSDSGGGSRGQQGARAPSFSGGPPGSVPPGLDPVHCALGFYDWASVRDAGMVEQVSAPPVWQDESGPGAEAAGQMPRPTWGPGAQASTLVPTPIGSPSGARPSTAGSLGPRSGLLASTSATTMSGASLLRALQSRPTTPSSTTDLVFGARTQGARDPTRRAKGRRRRLSSPSHLPSQPSQPSQPGQPHTRQLRRPASGMSLVPGGRPDLVRRISEQQHRVHCLEADLRHLNSGGHSGAGGLTTGRASVGSGTARLGTPVAVVGAAAAAVEDPLEGGDATPALTPAALRSLLRQELEAARASLRHLCQQLATLGAPGLAVGDLGSSGPGASGRHGGAGTAHAPPHMPGTIGTTVVQPIPACVAPVDDGALGQAFEAERERQEDIRATWELRRQAAMHRFNAEYEERLQRLAEKVRIHVSSLF